jgi:Fic family protein
MTKQEQLIEKLKEYIKTADRLLGNYGTSHMTLNRLRLAIGCLESEIKEKNEPMYPESFVLYMTDKTNNGTRVADWYKQYLKDFSK